MNYTQELIEKALHDPNLAPPGGCTYVNSSGKRCIVGTVLHLAGVEDAVLKGKDWTPPSPYNEGDDPNGLAFRTTSRPDLVQEAEIRYLDVDELRAAQLQWDEASGWTEEEYEEHFREIPLIERYEGILSAH